MSNEDKNQALILMATFNGDKYIRQQIDSIVSQSYCNWRLIIRDDGSSDETVSIANEYVERDSRITLVTNDGDKHGAFRNFWELMHLCKEDSYFEYCFFSDQDDVWDSEKLKIMIERGESHRKVPYLLYSDMRIIGEDNQKLFDSYDSLFHIGNQQPEATFFTRDIFWGCCMMVNRTLIEEIPLVDITDSRIDRMSHDTYLAEFASLYGIVEYIPNILISHRKHTGNVTGESSVLYSMRTIIDKIFRSTYSEKISKHAGNYAQSLIALEYFENHGFHSTKALEIQSAIYKGGICGVKGLKKYAVRKRQMSRNVALYYVMLTGAYKKKLSELIKKE